MTQMVLTGTQPATALWQPKNGTSPSGAGAIVCSFLDMATTSFGRATHYNTRGEQQGAELAAHHELFRLSRDLYMAFLALPGVTDRSRQIGTKMLLGTPRGADEFLTGEKEREVLYDLIRNLPASRMLKLLNALRRGDEKLGVPKANNARTRKLILRTLLSTPRIQLWAVKYRTKVLSALTHAWGSRLTSIIREILKKEPETRNAKENSILRKHVMRYALTGIQRTTFSETKSKIGDQLEIALQSVGFVLGIHNRVDLPLFKAFLEAKVDLSKGKRLPPEVLEGIRSTYHKNVSKDEVIRLTAKTMTSGQRLTVQKRAKKAGVQVDVDLKAQEAIKLYIHAFENGMTDEIREALEHRAKKAAAKFPVTFRRVGILVDASQSMFGDKTQKLRPMAVTLALRDMLEKTAEKSDVVYSGGTYVNDLTLPSGDTELAEGFLALLSDEPEAIFVLSDGYENTPAGRFGEVLDQVRSLGIDTPVYHLNPVFAAEAQGVRELAPGRALTLPVQKPDGLGTTIVRGLIETNPVQGINALLQVALAGGPAGRLAG